MSNFFSSDSLMILLVVTIIICGLGYYLGISSVKKIPTDKLNLRLLKVTEYSFLMLFIFFMVLMYFQRIAFLSAPNEFTKSATRDVEVYQTIQSLQMAHNSFYYVFFAWIITSLLLLRKTLQAEN